ncbi:hypothetical protein KOI35_17940 [Actinoplanes bogorensis]|uniref:Lipoprotein n=1 Tax=Paractinoplanes bogorensis TaxID=1610840 RepID=A0ABS5YQN1_9ACTN|nr:hypothetical protein [Actinoplanes bogorensis]MBU2665391.1 hypothetical protein [Actinoplanes bogorensis]
MRRRAAWFTMTVLLAGCASTTPETPPGPGGPASGAVPAPGSAATLDRLRERARVVLANYDAALAKSKLVLVPGQESREVGALEPANEHLKQVIGAGRLRPAGELPGAPREKGEAVWPTGERVSLSVISAAEGLSRLAQGRDCAGCVPHTVTAARLTTMRVATSRGPATVPAWEYTLQGTKMRVLRTALDSGPTSVDPPAGNPDDIPDGNAPESFRVEGRRLILKLVGPAEGADKPCGEDYRPEAVEGENAVAVLVQRRPYSGPEPSTPSGTEWGCTLVGHERFATVTLTAPLNGRTVLEVQQGQPVPLSTL